MSKTRTPSKTRRKKPAPTVAPLSPDRLRAALTRHPSDVLLDVAFEDFLNAAARLRGALAFRRHPTGCGCRLCCEPELAEVTEHVAWAADHLAEHLGSFCVGVPGRGR